ncbi:MAG: acyl-[acyl-carrier-protein]--UDP-N-acetylglucosamine O-acyltransferase [bacterium (Candidatus Stahlbacteria) CG08_land_8_20_14_0_20_40_26]|nr:MAG: acyl-[acyl-carrier-protein]--UDP-N-acetylglucosamine O-acyltransferase [bacterium (Candidatus Stahlbacteria) CG23_combo_of_CG06-09_8_20_14_all_40_9]PIS25724.1 MAG: acyl-[acyl-carrier-protein]--UDP-N-acetylglucosamine O-acyltransferase [bacterium (Candidatus Stahlbacteria) CG08_land_8_20_14_0_20_40_26]
MDIHKTAIINRNAFIDKDVKVGAYSVIERGVEIGSGCVIGNYVCIKRGTKIGRNNEIYEGAVIGNPAQDVRNKGKKSFVNIGANNIIREYVTIHRATGEGEETVIGDDNYLMAYCHIAHNVRVGNGVIIANGAQLAGFVLVSDYAFISGLCPVHQFVRIGKYSMIGGGYRVPKDVLPYSLTAGDPLRAMGLNIVGLRRHNFSKESISILNKAFHLLLSRELNTHQAIEKMQKELPLNDEIKHLIEFIGSSKRGVAI